MFERIGVCEKFPNTIILAGARKVRHGGYRGQVRTVECSAWRDCVSVFKSDCERVTRTDAMADAVKAAQEAVKAGYVPAF